MSDVVGKATYFLEADARKAKATVADLEKGIKASGATAEKAFSKQTTGALDKLNASMQRMTKSQGLPGAILGGLGIGAGIGVFGLVQKGVGMVTDAIGDSIKAASDQAEALSKVTVVFGDQAKEIEAWSKTAATSMGMTQTAALDAAGTLGNLFDGLGLTADAGADMSKKIVQLAADLGSFNNVDTASALDALKSGLLGEAEPMRKFGSALSAARVDAYALSSGMVKTKGSITDAVRIQARYALILQDTKNAQGDFARTADGMANSTKTLNSEFGDMEAQVGTTLKNALMPLLSTVVALGNQTPNTTTTVGKLTQGYRDLIAQQQFSNKEAQTGGTIWDDFVKRGTALVFAQDTAISEFTGTLGGFANELGVTRHDLALFTEAALTAGKTLPEVRAQLVALVEESAKTRWVKSYTWALDTLGAAAKETGSDIYGGLVHPVKHAFTAMFSTMADQKAPWKAAWKEIARLAKDPFRPVAFEDWLAKRAEHAAENAADAAKHHKPQAARYWAAFAHVMSTPVLAALATTEEAVAKLVAAAAVMDGVNAKIGNFQRNGSTGKHTAGYWQPYTNKNGDSGVRWVEAKALGGPVDAFKPYIVGEHGPEMIVPRSNGTVLTAQQTAAVGGPSVVDVRIHLTRDTARNLRDEGFNDVTVSALLRDASNQAHRSYSNPAR